MLKPRALHMKESPPDSSPAGDGEHPMHKQIQGPVSGLTVEPCQKEMGPVSGLTVEPCQ